MNGTDGNRQPGVSDAALAAWIDGTMDERGAAEMERMIGSDDILATRVARLRHLDSLVRAAVPEEPVPEALLQRLGLAEVKGRVTGSASGVVDLGERRAARAAAVRPAVGPGAGWRIAAQVALVAGVGSALLLVGRPQDGAGPVPAAEYTALGNAEADAGASAANALVMFAPGTDPAEARRVLAAAGLDPVGAVSAQGAWQVRADPARRAAALERLRALPGITMAEPLDGGTP